MDYMASAKSSNFSIDHIMGFESAGKGKSSSSANTDATLWTQSADRCPQQAEIYCKPNIFPVNQKLMVPPYLYLREMPYQSMRYDDIRNNCFGYASFNYSPPYFGQESFQNGAGGRHNHFVHMSAADVPRKRSRVRTVFTENQTQKLEHLFGVTDYPAAETREELAAKAGLSTETVRIWFKNRRARRRRQDVTKGRNSTRGKGGKRGSPRTYWKKSP